jgi:hypothetical protein
MISKKPLLKKNSLTKFSIKNVKKFSNEIIYYNHLLSLNVIQRNIFKNSYFIFIFIEHVLCQNLKILTKKIVGIDQAQTNHVSRNSKNCSEI